MSNPQNNAAKYRYPIFFLTTYFFRAILDPQFKKRHRGFSFTSLFPHIHSLPSKNMLHQTGTLVTGDGPAVTLHGCPRSTGYIRAQPVVVLYIQRFGRMYHDSSILTVSHRLVSLQGLCVWLLHSTSNPISATTDLFNIFIVLPFLECHVVGIIQCSLFR